MSERAEKKPLISAEQIRKARAVDMVELAGRYLKLMRHGREYRALCPFRSEKTPSFKVERERAHYHCFGCGAHGDAIAFVREMEGLEFVDAVEWLTGEIAAAPKLRVVSRTEKPVDMMTDAKVREARAMWHSAQRMPMSGLRPYFVARALPWPPPASVRFLPQYRWRGDSSMMLPAMLVAVQSISGEVIGVEATALTLRCYRKAFADSRDKKGIMGAGAARFAKATGVLGIAEGAETAIAAMHLLKIPTWASLGVGRIDRIAIPDTVREIVILADNDPAGRQGAERAFGTYGSGTRSVRAEWPPAGCNDWNDVLIERRRCAA